jgi:glutamate-5-semialdehyde dehydrogenase
MQPLEILKNTQQASKTLQNTSAEIISQVLIDLAELIQIYSDDILAENQKDLIQMDPADPKYDRLELSLERIQNLSTALLQVAKLPYPGGKILLQNTLESGIQMQKIAVPMGVIGIIYESRPNVTIDVAALCLRSGNAAVLKGGKEALHSNQVLVKYIHKALAKNNLPEALISLFPTDRAQLATLLEATSYVDLLIPRGSQALIDFVRQNAKIPTIETGAGVCHTFVEKTADLQMAADIIINARASRPSVCNSLDCAIVDQSILEDLLVLMLPGIEKYQIEIFADPLASETLGKIGYKNTKPASDTTYATEWLGYKMNLKTVNSFEGAIDHIEKFSSKHSEAIISSDTQKAETFLRMVDAAAVYHNASTRFTDGEEFGLGAEVGISTQKLHARGPFALEKLMTEKWICRGTGQTRW